MKKHKKMFFIGGLLTIGLIAVFAMTVSAQVTAKKIDAQKILVPPTQRIPGPCPDLAVENMRITLGKWGSMFAVVTANVVNRGTKAFNSKAGQAEALLIGKASWYTYPNTPGGQLVLNRIAITHLGIGQSLHIQGSFDLPGFQKSGCTMPPKPGECCRELQAIVMVSYDPDIRMDGNPDNDDCNASNNVCADTPGTHVKYTITCLKKTD